MRRLSLPLPFIVAASATPEGKHQRHARYREQSVALRITALFLPGRSIRPAVFAQPSRYSETQARMHAPAVAGVPPTPLHPVAGERRPRRASYTASSDSEGELHEDSGPDRRGRGSRHERRRTRRGAEGLLAGLGGSWGGGRLRRDPG